MRVSKEVGVIILLAVCLLAAPVAACHATIEKTVNHDEVCTGCSDLTYTLTLTYYSMSNYEVKVVDQLPAGLTNVVASDGGTYHPDTNTVTWNFTHVYSGVKTLTITATPATAGTLVNNANMWIRASSTAPWQTPTPGVYFGTASVKVDECGAVPEFPSLALPAGMILGIAYIIYTLKTRKD